jgi:hypothetical protein
MTLLVHALNSEALDVDSLTERSDANIRDRHRVSVAEFRFNC